MESNINISKFWTRIWAMVIDGILLGVFGYLLGSTIQDYLVKVGDYGVLLGLFIAVLYQTIFNSKLLNGQTLGKRAVNIQVVDIKGNTISLSKSFLRSLILSVPYFTINLTLPGTTNSSLINIIKTLVLSSIALGIVVIYIFNNGTRQSLHDLVIGSYVVTTDRKNEFVSIPPVSKKSYYIFGTLVVLLIGGYMYSFARQSTGLTSISSIYSKIADIEGIIKASVSESTTKFYGKNSSTIHSYNVTLWVYNVPRDNLENDKMVREVVNTILNNEKDIDNFDVITIYLRKEFNIGIASQRTTNTISKSPKEWREIIK